MVFLSSHLQYYIDNIRPDTAYTDILMSRPAPSWQYYNNNIKSQPLQPVFPAQQTRFMEKLNISNGFKNHLEGAPDTSVIEVKKSSTVGVSALDIPFIHPKLLVKEDEKVSIGSPLFVDKRCPEIAYRIYPMRWKK